ncbi:hypothetical protein V8C86DRAFT_1154470 [Haematococcus lacustris]
MASVGGGSESRLARLLSDAAVARGWRAVVYNRRGHGESTLLPASLHPVKKSRPSSGTRSPTQGGLPSQPLSAQQVAAALSAATSAAAASLVRLASSARGSRTSVPSGPCTQEAAAQELASQTTKLQPFHNTVSAGIPSSTCTQGATPAEGPAPQTEGPDRAAEVQRKQSLMQSMCKVFPRHSDVDDLAAVAQHLAQLFPTAPKLALGFSQGSNVLCHYLGLHANDPPPFTAAISVSNAFDLVTGTAALHLDWVTDALITRPLKRLLRKELAAVTELKEARNLQLDLVKALSTHHVREFDQALLVPAFGFGSVDEYYHTQSCKDVLMDICTPLLLLNNLDDPVIPPALSLLGQEAASRNPALIAVCTKRGGHLGWLQGWLGRPWLVDVMVDYMQAVLAAGAAGLLPGFATAQQQPEEAPIATVQPGSAPHHQLIMPKADSATVQQPTAGGAGKQVVASTSCAPHSPRVCSPPPLPVPPPSSSPTTSPLRLTPFPPAAVILNVPLPSMPQHQEAQVRVHVTEVGMVPSSWPSPGKQ